jgi:hypothetical protein
VEDLSVSRPSLEDIYLELTAEADSERAAAAEAHVEEPRR